MHKNDIEALVATMLAVIQSGAANRDGITRLWKTLQTMSEVIGDQNVIVAESANRIKAIERELSR